MQNYFKELENKVKVAYAIAGEARAKSLDPVSMVEVSLAISLAERVTGLISVKYPQVKGCGIEKRIKELEQQYGFLDSAVCLQIAEDVAREKFCKFQSLLEAMDAGIRIAFAYITLGVVSSPLEGYTHIMLKKTADGKDYIAAYFSGPVRSAGSTTAAFSLLIIDHLREIFGFARYDPTDHEAKRMTTEMLDYHERVTNLQYLPSEKEMDFISRNIPIQVTGDPSEEKEVSNYKDLVRIETNRIRNGPLLVLCEGLAQKAPKIIKRINSLRKNGFKLSDWNWFEDFVNFQKKMISEKKEKATGTYIQDLVAGRPVLAHPSRSGGFRLRYGRSRTSGYSAISISPVTMAVLNDFIAVGTQLKLEKPTKAAAVSACDSIEGSIVKLKDGSVMKLETAEKAKEIKKEISEIIYLGDILITYGDFLNRNHPLLPAGFCEEWWWLELQEKNKKLSKEEAWKISFEEALKLSMEYKIPMHPKYTFYWSQLNYDLFLPMLDLMLKGKDEGDLILYVNQTEREKRAKRALEIAGIPHKVENDKVIIEEQTKKILYANLGISKAEEISELRQKPENREGVLAFVNEHAKFKIEDKAGTFIGARMGRPEKAKLRKLVGSPHVLFPVGEEGGRLRSVQEAVETSYVKSDFPIYFCDSCKSETIYLICEKCGNECKKLYHCPICMRTVSDICPVHGGIQGGKIQPFMEKKIEIKSYLDAAMKKLNLSSQEMPRLIKGVRGTSSSTHVPENIAKGILRAQLNLNVNKDGTIRYDAIEVPITHFKPKEIGTSIIKLKELGYLKDIHGNDLENDGQIVEIKPQDILLPACPETLDEPADKVFISIAKFIDNLLVRFYGKKPFYNILSKEDLIGHLVACIAPHNCAGVVGRIIGFSNTQTFLASPYMHAAMRRDCDGDEAAMILLLDLLLNFSRAYLPAHRGGTQDAPLVLNARVRAQEVDDMIFNVDVVENLPLELYKASQEFKMPISVKVEQIGDRVLQNTDSAVFENLHYSHETSNIGDAAVCSAYKTLATMQEKVKYQMELAEKIRASDACDVARLVIERHFIRDIRGNLRKFSTQQFRCVQCNTKYRRPPLTGKCLHCGGKIIFTISEGSIIKYLEPAMQLAKKYHVSSYIQQSLELTKRYIESIFGRDIEKQQDLEKWFDDSAPKAPIITS
jgi:DNA polymerase II large subunit